MQTKMYNTEEFLLATKWTAFAGFGFLFGNITMQGIIATLQPLSWMFTIMAGFMAARHWYYATKKLNNKK